MSRYRRSLATGGTFCFTVTLADRGSRLLVDHIDRLCRADSTTQCHRHVGDGIYPPDWAADAAVRELGLG